MTRALSDYIQSPETRAFLGRVYRQWGVEWAVALTGALAAGDLIDCGDAPAGEQPAPLPASSGAPSGQEPVRGEAGGRQSLHLF